MNTIEAKISWFDVREGRGIATDAQGNEYYISIDVCKGRTAPLPNQLVRGEYVELSGTACLQNVRDFLDKAGAK